MKTIKIDKIKETFAVDGYVGNMQFEQLHQKSKLQLVAEEYSYELLMSDDDVIDTELVLYTDMLLPIKEGQQMGMCNIYLNDTLLDSIVLTAKESAGKWDFEKIWKLIFSKYLTFSS